MKNIINYQKESLNSILSSLNNDWGEAVDKAYKSEVEDELLTDDPEAWQEAYDEGDLSPEDFQG